MIYGQRVGETYEEGGRLVHEVDDHHAFRTDRSGRGLWRVDYGPHTPGGFREKQIEGTTQFDAASPADFRAQLGSWATPIKGYDVAIEVSRSDTGTYEIPGAAEPEDWHEARTEIGGTPEDHGELVGGGPWERVVRVADEDGAERWYFLAREWPVDA